MLSKSREFFSSYEDLQSGRLAQNELIRSQEIGSRSCQIKRVRNREAGTCSISNLLALWLLVVGLYCSHCEANAMKAVNIVSHSSDAMDYSPFLGPAICVAQERV